MRRVAVVGRCPLVVVAVFLVVLAAPRSASAWCLPWDYWCQFIENYFLCDNLCSSYSSDCGVDCSYNGQWTSCGDYSLQTGAPGCFNLCRDMCFGSPWDASCYDGGGPYNFTFCGAYQCAPGRLPACSNDVCKPTDSCGKECCTSNYGSPTPASCGDFTVWERCGLQYCNATCTSGQACSTHCVWPENSSTVTNCGDYTATYGGFCSQ